MAATVTGTFVLLDRATGPLRRIQQQAERTDRALAMAGDRLDGIGTRSQMAKHEELGRKLRETENNANLLNKRMGKTVGATDAVAAAAGRASVGMGGFGSAIGVVAVGVAALLPVISDLAGGLGALIGSLGRALKGASALAVGGVGVLGTALAGLAGTIVPTISNLGKLSEAFNAVSEAQQKYGKGSKEARDAMKEMVQARKSMENFDVKRGMAVITGFDTIKGEWSKMTSKGQSAILQMIIDTMNTTRTLMPMLARNANEIASATGVMMRTFLERLDGPEFRRFVDTMTNVYEKVAKPLGQAFANIGEALGNIAVAASGELIRLADVLRDASARWLDATSSVGEMGDMIAETSREMGDWYDLLVASWDWMVALFGPGADQGQGLVTSMTDKLNEQTEWFRRNPATMLGFYKQSTDGVRQLARFLGDIAPTLMDISDAMRPVVDAFETLVNLLSEIQIGKINALTVALVGFGVGKVGGLVKNLGQGFAGSMAAQAASAPSPEMASPFGEVVFSQAQEKFSPIQNVYIVGVAPQAAAAMGAGSGLFRSPGGGSPPIPVPMGGGGGAGGGIRGRFGRMVTAGGGFAAGIGSGMRQSAGGMFAGTRGVLGGMRGAGMAGAGALLGRGLMGGARLAGRAFLPLAALMGIGDFISTEGNVLDKLQGAASGATLGIIPGPKSAAEQRQEAMKPLFDRQGPVRLDPRTMEAIGTRNNPITFMGRDNDFTAQRREILAPFRRQVNQMRDIRQRNIAATGPARDGDGNIIRPLPLPTPRQLARQDEGASRQLAALSKAQGEKRGQDIVAGMVTLFEGGKAKRALTLGMNQLLRALDSGNFDKKTKEKMAAGVLEAANLIKKEQPKLKGIYDDLGGKVENRLSRMGGKVTVVNGNIVKNSKTSWRDIRDTMATSAERARQEVSDSFTAIQNQALGTLVNLGINRSQARRMIQSREGFGGNQNYNLGRSRGQGVGGYGGAGGPGGPGQAGGPGGGGNGAYGMRIKGFAGGGRLKGMGHRDTVPLTLGMAAPGELVVNRHTEGRVNQMLGRFGTSLGKEVGNENVPHSATPRPGRGPGRPHIYHAKGGRVAYPDAMGALPGLDALGYFLKQKFGLSVSSGLRPGAITDSGNPSDHGWGGAIDVSNGYATPQMDAAHAWLQSTFSGAIKQMLYRTMVGGNHFDHIHIALNESYARNPQAVARLAGGGGGAIGGMIAGAGRPKQINLRAPRTGMAGLLGAAAQGAMNLMTGGLEQSINRKLRGGGGRMGAGGGATVRGKATYFGGGMMASGLNTDVNPGIALNPNPGGPDPGSWDNETTRGWLENRQRFLVRVGGKSAVLPMLDKGPAGWTGNAIDVNMAGLAKMGYTTGTFPSGTVGTATALAKGGRVPFGGWYGNGGRFVTNGPTLIGVGEKGKETVQVTPAGKSAGAGGGIKIGNINIQNHRKGDIKRQVKEEINAAFAELEREVSGDTDGGVI